MKNIFKKIGYSTLIIIVAVFSVYGIASALAPTDNQSELDQIKPLIHPGQGHQFTDFLHLSDVFSGNGPKFSALSGSDMPSFFVAPSESVESFFASLGNAGVSLGKLIIGVSDQDFNSAGDLQFSNWENNFNWPVSADMQKVNVAGNVLATNLIHDSTESDSVCVDAYGSLVNCSSSSCTGVSPTNAVMCVGDNVDLSIDTEKSLVSSCSAAKCEFICAPGYTLSGGVCVVELNYTWELGELGDCIGDSVASCSGTPSGGGTETKLDWKGEPFEWTDGNLHQVISPIAAFCGDNNDLLVGEHVHANGGTNSTACIIGPLGEFPAGIMYEVSVARNSWDRHTVDSNGTITAVQTNYAPAYGPENGIVYRSRCDMNNNGTWTDDTLSGVCSNDNTAEWEDTGISCSPVTDVGLLPMPTGINQLSTVVNGTDVICYAPATGTSSCNGTTESSCETVSGCNWNEASSIGTQTQSYLCKDSSGNTVADLFCIDSIGPEPEANTQSCILGGFTGTPGCYPIEYGELLGSYSQATAHCNTKTSKLTCMGQTNWWNSAYGIEAGNTYPAFASEPTLSDDYAIHSYGDTSTILVDINDLDLDGVSLPVILNGGDPANIADCNNINSGASCYRVLGPVCIWGEQ